ncbi:MAG: RNA polymerase sigma factor [Streptosporangiaceae bacterium]
MRGLAPQVLGALVRRHRSFDLCEDAVQDALMEAAAQWPTRGIPDHPRAWLATVATRRLIDRVRSDHSRRQREERVIVGSPPAEFMRAPDEEASQDRDDSLILLLMCCHPALSPPTQIALTLRAVGGLTTAEIAGAFLVPEATMAQRISRAKQGIREAGATFSMPPPAEMDFRLRAVLQVLYLIFNEGYTTSSGDEITRTDLTHEAIRLMRQLRLVRPGDAEVKGLLALMLLTEARRPARIDPAGRLVDLADQDRSLWNQSLIEEGVQLVTEALQQGPPGAYQLQAAIAAIYDEASHPEDTDWPQILLLYQLLDRLTPNPMATLNRALALAMVAGPQAGLDLLATLDDDKRVASHHRLFAVRGHLLEMAGNSAAATEAFETAARRCTSLPERAYLQERARAALRR